MLFHMGYAMAEIMIASKKYMAPTVKPNSISIQYSLFQHPYYKQLQYSWNLFKVDEKKEKERSTMLIFPLERKLNQVQNRVKPTETQTI